MYWNESILKSQLSLFVREISLRTYQDCDVIPLICLKNVFDAASWESFIFKAIGDQFQTLA